MHSLEKVGNQELNPNLSDPKAVALTSAALQNTFCLCLLGEIYYINMKVRPWFFSPGLSCNMLGEI